MQIIKNELKEKINIFIFLAFAILVGAVFFISFRDSGADRSLLQKSSPRLYAALVGNTTQATLKLTPDTGTYNVNDNFSVDIYVDTNSQNVDTVAAYLNYNSVNFQVVSIDTTGSLFTMQAENDYATPGVIKITRGIPAPSFVNNSNGFVAKINFKAVSSANPSSDNITFNFVAGDANRSNVFLAGNPLLSGVYNGRYTVSGGSSDSQAPSVPTNLSASAVSSSQINLSWTASTDNVGVTGYRIFRNGVQAGTSATNSYNDSGLSPSTTYNYNVSAYDAAGNESGQSSQASATTQSGNVPVTLSVSLSASPSSGAAPLSGVSLTVNVSGGSGNINYTFYCNRSDSGINITTPYDIKIDNQSQTSYTASNICNYSSAGSYTAKVIVERDSSQAESRVTVTVTSSQPPPPSDTTPPAISSVSASLITSNSATINWATNEVASSQVEYGLNTNYGTLSGFNSSLVTSHSVLLSGLSPSTTYHYRVKSSDTAGNPATSGDYTFITTAASLTLSVNLSAAPSSGVAPLSGVDLIASVSGSATGNINYTFYCNRGDIGINITTPYQGKFDNQAQTSYTANDICNYQASGSYGAKVIAERGSYKAEARVSVIVNPKPAGGGASGGGSATNFKPIGYIDEANGNLVSGWVFDANANTSPVTVHIYVDGTMVGSSVANLSRSDIMGAGSVVKDVNHGFSYNFSNLSQGEHTVRVYAIDVPAGNEIELGSSPKTITVEESLSFLKSVPKAILTNQILFFISLFIIIFIILKMIF